MYLNLWEVYALKYPNSVYSVPVDENSRSLRFDFQN